MPIEVKSMIKTTVARRELRENEEADDFEKYFAVETASTASPTRTPREHQHQSQSQHQGHQQGQTQGQRQAQEQAWI